MTDEDPSDGRAWQRRLTRNIAGEIRRYRELKGWTTQRLADECARQGVEIARSTLAGMETGRREGITAAETLIIARALNVSPIALLAPVGPTVKGVQDPSGQVELAPGEFTPVSDALLWLDGTIGAGSRDWVAAMRKHGQLVMDWLAAQSRIGGLRTMADDRPAERDQYLAMAARQDESATAIESAIAEHRRFMRAQKQTPPPLPRVLATLIGPMEPEQEVGCSPNSSR